MKKKLLFVYVITVFTSVVIGAILIRYDKKKDAPQWQYGFGIRNLTSKKIYVKQFKVYPRALSLGGERGPFAHETITDLPPLVRPNRKVTIEWKSCKPVKKFKNQVNVILPEIVNEKPELLHRIYFNIDLKNCFCSYEIMKDKKQMITEEILTNGTVFNYMKVMKNNGFTSWKDVESKIENEKEPTDNYIEKRKLFSTLPSIDFYKIIKELEPSE
jgi:hypothetical protein